MDWGRLAQHEAFAYSANGQWIQFLALDLNQLKQTSRWSKAEEESKDENVGVRCVLAVQSLLRNPGQNGQKQS